MTLTPPLTPNGPLSRLRERAGERVRSQPKALQPPGNPVREQARSYTAPRMVLPCRSAPCARIAGRARSYRMTSDLTATPDSPLSRLRERAGERVRSQPKALQPPGNPVREQARSYTAPRMVLPCRSAPCARIAQARSYRMTSDLTATPNGPLSRLRERAGERVRSQPKALQPPGSPVRKQARSYTAPRMVPPCRSAPCARIAGRARSYRMTSDLTATPDAPSPACGRGLGRGCGVNPKHCSRRVVPFASKLAPTQLHAWCPPVGARPARESRAGPAPTG